MLRETVLAADEMEALRLADAMGLYHKQAAEQMGISRQTFERILNRAREKVSTALVEGLAIRIDAPDPTTQTAQAKPIAASVQDPA